METGKILMTKGIAELVSENSKFSSEIYKLIIRYIKKDWGDLSEDDKLANDSALKNNNRISAAYNTKCGKVWIITEWDRSYTTILFPDEY